MRVRDPVLRPARVGEAPALANLSRRTIESGLTWRWRASAIAACIRDDESCVVVARGGNALIGFAAMSFEFEASRAHLLLLAVSPANRRQGVARALVDWLECVARRGGIAAIRLEVREKARAARAFYEVRGYRERGRLPGYYQGVEDALRLEKRFGGRAA